jgi:hypothetical protein
MSAIEMVSMVDRADKHAYSRHTGMLAATMLAEAVQTPCTWLEIVERDVARVCSCVVGLFTGAAVCKHRSLRAGRKRNRR